jgi:hypothetical protein
MQHKVARRSSPWLAGPFRADSGGGNSPRVNPELCFIGRFGPRIYVLEMSKLQVRWLLAKIAFRPQRTTLSTCFQQPTSQTRNLDPILQLLNSFP